MEGCVNCDGEEGREEGCCSEGEKGERSTRISWVFRQAFEGYRESYLRRKCGIR